jgi:hypothetical protein
MRSWIRVLDVGDEEVLTGDERGYAGGKGCE